MRQIDSFSSAVILTKLELFEPGQRAELAFFGRLETGRIAVLDGELRTGNQRDHIGLVVVREMLGDPQAYVDRTLLTSTLKTDEGGRRMWLSRHEGKMPEGILEISAGRAAFAGVDIVPIDPTDTLTACGSDMAYCNGALPVQEPEVPLERPHLTVVTASVAEAA